jgi:hypothetical protein
VAWGEEVQAQVVSAAHRVAWDTASEDTGSWIHAFIAERSLSKKLGILIRKCKNEDEGSQGIAQFIAHEPRERLAAFALAVYPAMVMGKLPIGADGVNDLGKIASTILSVDGVINWQERICSSGTDHPEVERFYHVINRVKGARAERAKQFFNWCLVEEVVPENPAALEAEIERCVNHLKRKKLV